MSYNELITLIDAVINRNGVQAITGQVLNGVLKAMVQQLGAGYALGGVAHPTDDPGTPDAPVCYFASETGTYTNFDNLTIAAGELALICYDLNDGWSKSVMYDGFQSVQASVDNNVGTPDVQVSYNNGVLSFAFENLKGNTGDAAGFGTISASVDDQIGTPSVSVQESGPDTAKNLAFAFHNLKGETGVTSVLVSVDNTSGTPQCAVSLNGQQLTLAFTGLKGAQGDTGVSADYPITIVNNLTTNDPTSALSAAQGVVLEGEISQLELEVNGKDNTNTISKSVTSGQSINFTVPFTLPAGTYSVNVVENILGTTNVYLYFKDSGGTVIVTKRLSAYIQDGLTLSTDCASVLFYEDRTVSADGDIIIRFEDDNPVTGIVDDITEMQNDIAGLDSGISELDLQINGHDKSETLTKSVTSGQSINFTVPFALSAGTYSVNVVENILGTTDIYLYFKDSGGTVIVAKKLSAFLTDGLTLTEDCASVLFYRDDTASQSGDIIIRFEDEAKVKGITDDVAGLELEINGNGLFKFGHIFPANTGIGIETKYDFAFPAGVYDLVTNLTDSRFSALALNIYFFNDNGEQIRPTDSRGSVLGSIVVSKEIENGPFTFGVDVTKVAFYSVNTPANDISLVFSAAKTTRVVGLEERVSTLEEEVLQDGSIPYFGERINVDISSQKNRMQSETIVQHTPSSYAYTRYNQSMAIHNGFAFCFNDTSEDCFCVVIDLSDGTVMGKVDDIPSVVGSSHLNNANFTDVYFDPFDDFPLLLLSRGDYADGTLDGQEMYIFRITKSGSAFVFTHIKTIKHRGTYYFNPNWEYDSARKMIWGHLNIHGDHRWGDFTIAATYRKFNGIGLYFAAFADTHYITIGTDEVASADATITMNVGSQWETHTKTVSVHSGETIDPTQFVMPYPLTPGGYSWISLNQSANAFTGKYVVFACDENGNNRIPINMGCVLRGFPAPDLRDGTEVTITDEDMTQEVEIDSGIMQGGCCIGGKLVIPFGSFQTINGQPFRMDSQAGIVVNPISGDIESVFPTGTLENQGCAVYNGKIYISSHNANAQADGTSFNIIAYSF